jgi:hypothetical protein
MTYIPAPLNIAIHASWFRLESTLYARMAFMPSFCRKRRSRVQPAESAGWPTTRCVRLLVWLLYHKSCLHCFSAFSLVDEWTRHTLRLVRNPLDEKLSPVIGVQVPSCGIAPTVDTSVATLASAARVGTSCGKRGWGVVGRKIPRQADVAFILFWLHFDFHPGKFIFASERPGSG